jgi:hypothetical protein
MFLGSGLANSSGLLIGLLVTLVGYGLEIWGCVNYVRWKGHSGWFGLFGYLLLPGILILVFFPNRRLHANNTGKSRQGEQLNDLANRDRCSSYLYLLALAPLGVLAVIVGWFMHSVGSAIASTEWQEVNQRDIGFQALMPGVPRMTQDVKETPAGKIELHKFMVEPKGKKELFMVVSVRFPEDLAKEMGGVDKLLDAGRDDILSAVKGKLTSEKQFDFNGHPGLEMELLPPKGAVVKARVVALTNQIYEIWVHVPQVRLGSPDVQKFIESFRLLN